MAKAGMRRPDPSDPHAHGDENYGKTNKKPKNEYKVGKSIKDDTAYTLLAL